MANVYPRNVQFLLADAVRQEEGGKLTVLGLYSGDAVLLKDSLPNSIPEGMEGLALPGLTIVAIVRDGQGSFSYGVHLYGPDGKALGKGVDGMKLDKKKDAPASLLIPVQPFPIPDFGTYRVLLQLNRHEYEFKFRVSHIDPNAAFPEINKSKNETPSNGRRTPGKGSAQSEKSKTARHKGNA